MATALGFAVPPVAGRLTHRWGPRAVVVLAQVVQGLGAAAYLIAADASGVAVAAGLLAAGAQLFYCALSVLVADVSSGGETKERAFAVVGMVRAGAFGLGTLTAGASLALADRATSLRWLAGIDAASFVVAALTLACLVATPPVDHPTPNNAGPLTVLRTKPYLLLMLATSSCGLAVDFALVGTPVFVLDVVRGPSWLPGALLAMSTALTTLLGVQVVRRLRSVPRTRSLQISGVLYLLFALAFAMLPMIPGGWLVAFSFAAWLIWCAGNNIFFPVSAALSEALPPRHSRAGFMATFQYSYTVAQVLTPVVVGLFAVASWLPWLVVAGTSLAGIALSQRLGSAIPDTHNQAAASAAVG